MDAADDRFRAALDRLVADAVAVEAARQRSQTRTLREVAEAEATFTGVALDLAERATVIVARTSSGRTFRGRIVAVGRDFLVVRDAGGPFVLLATWGLTSLRPQPAGTEGSSGDISGARAAPLTVGLAALLSRLAADRPRVQVAAVGEEPVAGELRSVGVDVLTVRLDGDAGMRSHVRLGAVTELVLLEF